MLRPLFILFGLAALVPAADTGATFPGEPRYDGTVALGGRNNAMRPTGRPAWYRGCPKDRCRSYG
jgi:hypothetical protein